MSEQFTYDHNLCTLDVNGVDTHLDVLCFHGEEQLSQPFTYIIEFTASDLDVPVDCRAGAGYCPAQERRSARLRF
jgi:hypothetical protein